MYLLASSFRRPWLLVVVLGVVHLVVVLLHVLCHMEIKSFLPFFNTASLKVTSLPSDWSMYDANSATEMDKHNVSGAAEGQISGLSICPKYPPHLVGRMNINFTQPISLEMVQKVNSEVVEGGRWWPRDCIARQKVAVIIPFRHREFHLKYWLHYLHPILQRQQLDYGIYVINQYGETTFNRGKLMNVGYAEARKQYDYRCFVFSDVDIVPMDDRNFYKCYSQPRHLSVAIDKFGFRLPYMQIFGGVTALSLEQFTKINGYPNNYWGWGGEDDDISQRVSMRGMFISRPDGQTGRCRMIKHHKEAHNAPNPKRFDNLRLTGQTINSDGLSSLQYRVVSVEKNPLYTNVTVDIGSP
ncbi:beta-1,4-galactosyltransferase 1-like [Alosa sapidissima]|uniref:beta-1,4-galactosyltransferase 1-like n=1 Tax=Alosa sapidissima TaxID=34773 RepID=UPI001C0A5BF3|nr:beta-1,4-galactosyltransferase 1-like [Alosa sapidissima]